MTSYIKEFNEAEKPKDYHEVLVDQVEKLNGIYNAFNVINKSARHGFPFSTKANLCVKGFETNAGSKMLKGYVPPFNATVADRMLAKEDFSFIGVANMDEFGFGTFGINTEIPAKNAFDSEYVAGGSSSGSAVATAMIKYHVSVAESTGGSISAPAALNGVVGFTPTYGSVSRYGLIDYANSLDKIGVMARRAEDARIVFDRIRGGDGYDATCSVEKITSENKKRIFVVNGMLSKASPKVRSAFERLLDKLGKDYTIEYVDSGAMEKAIAPYYIIAMAEASTNLAKYTGYKYGPMSEEFYKQYNEFFTDAREGFGMEAKRRILLGTFIRSESVKDKYYTRALVIRGMVIREMDKLLKDGYILSPTLPITAPKISDAKKLTPVENYAMDLFTIPPNLGGFPHVSFPYDYIDGMPLGAQLVTGHGNDYAILDFVKEWEEGFEYMYKHNLGSL